MIATIFVALCSGLSLPNGQATYNPVSINGQYSVGTTASITCDSGYYLKGSNSRTCQPTGTWNQQTPCCQQSKKMLFFT